MPDPSKQALPEQQGWFTQAWSKLATAYADKVSANPAPSIELPKNPLAGTVGKLPELSPSQWVAVAKQTRPLSRDELNMLHQRFGQALNPMMLRVGYDQGSAGTNLGGWVDPKILPTVAFLNPKGRPGTGESGLERGGGKTDAPHEFTHIWQNLGGKYDPYEPSYSPNPDLDTPFERLGQEQQAEQVQYNNSVQPRYYMESHPGRLDPSALATVALLDSYRQLGNQNPDTAARRNAFNGITMINQTAIPYQDGPFKGYQMNLKYQDPFVGPTYNQQNIPSYQKR